VKEGKALQRKERREENVHQEEGKELQREERREEKAREEELQRVYSKQ
jgi:hypothetical protein